MLTYITFLAKIPSSVTACMYVLTSFYQSLCMWWVYTECPVTWLPALGSRMMEALLSVPQGTATGMELAFYTVGPAWLQWQWPPDTPSYHMGGWALVKLESPTQTSKVRINMALVLDAFIKHFQCNMVLHGTLSINASLHGLDWWGKSDTLKLVHSSHWWRQLRTAETLILWKFLASVINLRMKWYFIVWTRDRSIKRDR